MIFFLNFFNARVCAKKVFYHGHVRLCVLVVLRTTSEIVYMDRRRSDVGNTCPDSCTRTDTETFPILYANAIGWYNYTLDISGRLGELGMVALPLAARYGSQWPVPI